MLSTFRVFIGFIFLSGCTSSPKTDHSADVFAIQNPPKIGETASGQSIFLGGFSGLWIVNRIIDQITIVTVTDRGPNGEKVRDRRPFLLPAFHPRITKLNLSFRHKRVEFIEEVPLRRGNRFFTGLPFPMETSDQVRQMEVPISPSGEVLATDQDGIDPESICMAKDGTFWIGEEYGPDLLHFSSEGSLLKRYRAGAELPAWLKRRKANGGFEGVACVGDFVFAILQSPLQADSRDVDHVPILKFDTKLEKVVDQFFYPLHSKDHKVGDLFAAGDGQFFVIEQNGQTGSGAFQKIFEFTLSRSIEKSEVLDLVQAGFQAEKAEGLAIIGDEAWVISDNDFSLSKDGSKTQIGRFRVRRGQTDSR